MRITTRRTTRALAATAALALVLTACGGDGEPTGEGGDTGTGGDTEAAGDSELLAELQESGTIQVGIAGEVPYGFEDEEGNVTGEAPEVAKIVLGEMGIDNMEASVVEFGSLISGLLAGQYDMVAAGMYITPDRAEQILFSDPDYCVGESLAVAEGNPLDIHNFRDVAETPEATIAILSGAVEEGYAETAGVPTEQIELFTDVNAQYSALQAGRVDAVTGTTLTIQTQVQNLEGFEATESFFPLDADGEEILGCGGFGFRPENQAFRDAFNEKLNELQESGDQLVEAITQFGFAESDVRRAQDLTVQDLLEQ